MEKQSNLRSTWSKRLVNIYSKSGRCQAVFNELKGC